ncbi:Crp/Fnr family transcriptional regulator [Variovorax robiniae]|uniref:Crp/Fnr family transcriptional regulator n=1 Tax=Variovorax robiniae TaxID=1836199 RepID=A0ABU8XIC7_9BURK
MLVQGALHASIEAETGRRHLLTFVPPGMMVGLLPCMDDGRMVHDTVARIPSVVLKMAADVVRHQRNTVPSLRVAFDVQLAWRARGLYDMVAEQMLHSLRQRLSQQLVQLVTSFGKRRGREWEIVLRLPQADLADLLGASRQSINIELRALEKMALIRIRNSHIDVLDLAALRAECGRLVAWE